MAVDRLTIDEKTIFDNAEEGQVEFAAELDGERYEFAIRYDVLEAMSGEFPVTEPATTVRRNLSRIAEIAPSAVNRAPAGTDPIVISESDLD